MSRYNGIGTIRVTRWLKRHRARKVRHRINQLVRIYAKTSVGEYLHLPQPKEIFDIWTWD